MYASGQVTIGQSDNAGSDGVGTLNVTDATLTTPNDIMLGYVGGTGSMTVNGSAKVNALDIQAGWAWGGSPVTDVGIGHITVNNGTVNVTNWLIVGSAGGVGDMTINGGTTTVGIGTIVGQWDYNNGATVGSGTLTLKGGVLVTPSIQTYSDLSETYSEPNGTVYFDGGTVTASADALTGFMFSQGVGDTLNLYVTTGGALIDTAGHTVNQTLWLQHDPALGPRAGRRFDQARRRNVGSVYEPVV